MRLPDLTPWEPFRLPFVKRYTQLRKSIALRKRIDPLLPLKMLVH